MKIIEIDKSLYRKTLNLMTIVLVISLSVLSLVFGTALIAAFGVNGSENVVSGESTGNFHLNLLGVVLAAATCVGVIIYIKDRPWLKEVYYVWRLKALHNRIYRRLKSINTAAKLGDVNALTILSYYYTGLKQVYFLDNNTLTISKVDNDIAELASTIAEYQLKVSAEQFSVVMLTDF
ncbi:DUF3087 domain-containing protein [Shewanella sp. VB17]|uniref:DUF3087 domain-containing protein n=1 Tax=Shewanella sp. VB17 TaxID=2739432 RepID=UPI0015668109|nr:DUF3087 domain-containing protein [Shewanella sp. VB17]NRD72859.1 DUF3087 domain-containing protein [Shewanella sp. VB17]